MASGACCNLNGVQVFEACYFPQIQVKVLVFSFRFSETYLHPIEH